MDINVIVGGVITILVVVFALAPFLGSIICGDPSYTYLGNIVGGIVVIVGGLIVVAICLLGYVAYEFITGNFDVVSDMINKAGI